MNTPAINIHTNPMTIDVYSVPGIEKAYVSSEPPIGRLFFSCDPAEMGTVNQRVDDLLSKMKDIKKSSWQEERSETKGLQGFGLEKTFTEGEPFNLQETIKKIFNTLVGYSDPNGKCIMTPLTITDISTPSALPPIETLI
jgi:hypothetical protein